MSSTSELRPGSAYRDMIRAAYLGVLGREPDEGGLESHCAAMAKGAGLSQILERMVQSSEFAQRRDLDHAAQHFPMEGAPPITVETSLSQDMLDRLWQHVAATWTRLGRDEPYWSVLIGDRWRMNNMTGEEGIKAFYATGRMDVQRLEAWLARNGGNVPRDGVCAEYGCGVGRVTRWLAERFKTVRAFDISEGHLETARKRLTDDGIGNVEYVLVRGPDEFRHLAGCDFFFSMIVLQHNPPPIITQIVDRALAGLRPGGTAYFQVPTYMPDYEFRLSEYAGEMSRLTDMEMHVLPQRVVFDLAAQNGCRPLEVQPDSYAGPGMVSNTFLFRKNGGVPPA